MELLGRAQTLVLAGTLGFMAGCPFGLPDGQSCGDGWWNEEHEGCDPRDGDRPWLDACRAKGFAKDAACDPLNCEILDSEADCNECGDGVAAGDEQCDGQDLKGETCDGTLTCDADCQLDYSACGEVCGDGVLLGDEECEVGVEPDNQTLACDGYESTAFPLDDKPYASGMIGACHADTCKFGRNDCSFCGDGVLDPKYWDTTAPHGTVEFPAEVCDGDEVDPTLLQIHCEERCVDEPINGDVVLECESECEPDCSAIAPVGGIAPEPESLGCCLAKHSPCPNLGIAGVPGLPCCSWLENPEWEAIEFCVDAQTGVVPPHYICP